MTNRKQTKPNRTQKKTDKQQPNKKTHKNIPPTSHASDAISIISNNKGLDLQPRHQRLEHLAIVRAFLVDQRCNQTSVYKSVLLIPRILLGLHGANGSLDHVHVAHIVDEQQGIDSIQRKRRRRRKRRWKWRRSMKRKPPKNL